MTENQKLALAWVNGLRRTHHLGDPLEAWPENAPPLAGARESTRSATCPIAEAIEGYAAPDMLVVGSSRRKAARDPEGTGSILIQGKAVPNYVNDAIREFDREYAAEFGEPYAAPSASEGI